MPDRVGGGWPPFRAPSAVPFPDRSDSEREEVAFSFPGVYLRACSVDEVRLLRRTWYVSDRVNKCSAHPRPRSGTNSGSQAPRAGGSCSSPVEAAGTLEGHLETGRPGRCPGATSALLLCRHCRAPLAAATAGLSRTDPGGHPAPGARGTWVQLPFSWVLMASDAAPQL